MIDDEIAAMMLIGDPYCTIVGDDATPSGRCVLVALRAANC